MRRRPRWGTRVFRAGAVRPTPYVVRTTDDRDEDKRTHRSPAWYRASRHRHGVGPGLWRLQRTPGHCSAAGAAAGVDVGRNERASPRIDGNCCLLQGSGQMRQWVRERSVLAMRPCNAAAKRMPKDSSWAPVVRLDRESARCEFACCEDGCGSESCGGFRN